MEKLPYNEEWIRNETDKFWAIKNWIIKFLDYVNPFASHSLNNYELARSLLNKRWMANNKWMSASHVQGTDLGVVGNTKP